MERRDFDPRSSALNYAAQAETLAQMNVDWKAKHQGEVPLPTAEQFGQGVEALTCALLFVGEQLSAITNLLEQLDVTLNNTGLEIAKQIADAA